MPWKSLIGQAKEEAPDGFTDRVMARLEQEAAVQAAVQPLISRRAWFVIAAWAVSLMAAGVYFWSGGDVSGLGIAHAYLPEIALDFGGVAELPELSSIFAWCGIALFIFAGLHLRWMYRRMAQNLTV